MKLKHNKKRNTAFIYEVLINEVSKASMHEIHERKRATLNILKKYFHKGSPLKRELEVYRGNVKAEAINEAETMSTLSVASSLRKTGRGNSPDAKSVRIGMDQENAVKRDRAKFDVNE